MQKKQSEHEPNVVNQTEKRYRQIWESMDEGFALGEMIYDEAGKPVNFRYLDINPAFAKLTGLPAENVFGRTVKEVIPSIEPYWIEKYGRVVQSGCSERFENFVSELDKWYEVYAWRFDAGQFAVLFTDVTERKVIEKKLAYLASFPDINPMSIVELDMAGNVVFLNNAARKQFPDLEVNGVKHPFLTGLFDLLKEQRPGINLTREVQVNERFYEQLIFPVEKGQRIRSYSQDITERKRAETKVIELNKELNKRASELESANRELEAFSYSVSHDLRAPLRSIEGFAQALNEDYMGLLDAQGKDFLNRIQKSSQLMAELIDDMLTLSRVSRHKLHKKKINLSFISERIVAELKNTDPEREVEFVIEPGMTARGDENLLAVVLKNLIDNAWKFSSKKPSAKIEVGKADHINPDTYFVRDNGAGFEMAYVSKLFVPFQRLHTPNEYPGNGIGLATVQRIIRRHNGKVWAESEVNHGTTFYFTLE